MNQVMDTHKALNVKKVAVRIGTRRSSNALLFSGGESVMVADYMVTFGDGHVTKVIAKDVPQAAKFAQSQRQWSLKLAEAKASSDGKPYLLTQLQYAMIFGGDRDARVVAEEHRQHVEIAVQQALLVPDIVLIDYPDIALRALAQLSA